MPDEYDQLLDSVLPKTKRPPFAYDEIINRNAQRTGLDPNLIRGVISQESTNNPNAVSPKGARGLMQLMPATAQRFGVTNVHDPEQNIRGGTDYLKFLNDRFRGNTDLVLAGYNAGEGAVDKFHGIPPFKETQNYVPAVKARMRRFGGSVDTPVGPDPYDQLLDEVMNPVSQDSQVSEMAQVGAQAKGLTPELPTGVRGSTLPKPSITDALTTLTRNVQRETAKLEKRLPKPPEIVDAGPGYSQSSGLITREAQNAMSARQPGILERIKETVAPYVPGLSTLDTAYGVKTDPVRGAVSGVTLGYVGDPRQVSPEEAIIDPEAQKKADTAHFAGEVLGQVVPYVGVESLLAKGIKGTTLLPRAIRTAATFSGVEAGRQGVNAVRGRPVDPKAVAESAVLGAVTAGLAGENPNAIRRVAAYVSPTAAIDIAKGVPAEQAVKSALVNAGFALTGGGKAESETMSTRARLSPEAQALVEQARTDVAQAVNTPQVIERPTIPEAQQNALRASAMQETLSPAANAPKLDPQLQEVPSVSRIETVTEAPKLNRWNHRDFGLVTESTDQAKVPTGKVRVLDQQGVEHVIQRASGTGAGNQIAVRVRETPQDLGFKVIDRRSSAQPAQATNASPEPATMPPTEAAQPVAAGAASTPEIDRLQASYDRAQGRVKELRQLARDESGSVGPLHQQLETAQKAARGLGMQLSAAQKVTPVLRREVILSESTQKGEQTDVAKLNTASIQAPRPSTGAQPSAPLITRERSFPKSAEAAGLPQATDLTYAINTDIGATERANQRIKEHGIDRVIADIQSGEGSKDDIVAGSIVAHQLTEKGDLSRAVDVVDTLSRKLTNAGQTSQAASLIARLSPEGVLMAAQKRMLAETKLKPVQASILVEHAVKVREAEAKVSSLEEQIAQLKLKPTPIARGVKIETLQDRLTKTEQEARARLAARAATLAAEKATGIEYRHSGIPIDVKTLADYAVIGAAKLARKGITLAQWTEEMIKEFGDGIKPHLKGIYADAYKHYDEQRKTIAVERERRSAMKEHPVGEEGLQRLINQRVQARKDLRTSQAELARRFNALTSTGWQRFKAQAVDVINVPRTLKSSVDLSAPRQAAMFIVNHPIQGAKVFFGKQLKAMREVNYDKFVDELQSDPDYPLMQRSELALSTTARDVPYTLTRREEAFTSRLAGKLPLIKHSERAYTTFLDTARSSWFKQLARQAEAKAATEGKPITPQQYKDIANFVNIATGRGNLGKGWINDASPFLNAVLFAPKFAASKVQIFDPRVYARLPKGARATAMREATTYFAAMTTTAMLLKYGLGAKVGMNPEDSDFMKLVVGKTHYDLANGTGQYITFAARLLRNAENKAEHKKDAFGKSFMENVDRFVRYKYSPIAGAVRNTWEGKNAIGEKTNVKNELKELVIPLFMNDLYKAYKEEGLTGVAKTSPGFVGVGVNTYDQKKVIHR